jgi:hypothetical protein
MLEQLVPEVDAVDLSDLWPQLGLVVHLTGIIVITCISLLTQW